MQGQQWHYNLINFNSTHIVSPLTLAVRCCVTVTGTLLLQYKLPSFSVQALLSAASNGYTVEATESGTAAYRTSTSYDPAAKQFHIKFANYNASSITYAVTFADGIEIGSTFTMDLLYSSSGPGAYNTLDNPNAVAPTHAANVDSSKLASLAVPEWSLLVVHVDCTSC